MRKVLFAVALLAGCYETPKPACAFLCGTGGACPDGYACSTDDNRCHLVQSGGGLAACTDTLPGDAMRIDASISFEDGGPDATPLDAMPLDAMPLDAPPDAATSCSPALAPLDDGSSASRQELLVSEIHPGSGGFIELYDNTASAIDLGTRNEVLVSDGVTVTLATAGTGVTILSHGETTIPWPATFTTANDTSGEVAMYIDATQTDLHLESFVCWGTGAATTSVKGDAETGGKWAAATACPGPLTASAIHRLPAAQGLAAADFDVAAAPTAETCGP